MKCEIRFDKIIRHQTNNENEIEVCDNLGKLTNFVVFCVINCDKHELNFDTSVLRELFSTLMGKVCMKDLEQLDIVSYWENSIIGSELHVHFQVGTVTQKMNQTALQFVGLLEALMNYALWTSTSDNNNVKLLHSLFKHHQKLCTEMKVCLLD